MKAGTTQRKAASPRRNGHRAAGKARAAKSAPRPGSAPAQPAPKAFAASAMAGPVSDSGGMNAPQVRQGPAVVSTHFIRARIGKICVAITGATPAEMLDNAEQIVRENHFVEFRLDYLANPL